MIFRYVFGFGRGGSGSDDSDINYGFNHHWQHTTGGHVEWQRIRKATLLLVCLRLERKRENYSNRPQFRSTNLNSFC